MTLLVRDEADIVEANLQYHFAQGVDLVIATDNRSEDGTVEILERYEQAGRLRLLHEREDDYSQGRWVTRMARMARLDHGADWVINADADEFWWPAAGDLVSTLETVPHSFGVVVAERYNFICRPWSDEPFYRRMLVRQAPGVNHPGYEIRGMGPKVCHRGNPTVVVHQGNHAVEGEGLGGPQADHRIDILHYPVRSYRQFENKILRGGRAYERNQELPEGMGKHWRDLLDEHRRGRFQRIFEQFVLDDRAVDDGLAEGSLVVDTRLRDFFESVAPPLSPPESPSEIDLDWASDHDPAPGGSAP